MNNRETGTILDGKYEILDRLGGGGMGEVYLVRHLHLEEKRVIKVLRPEHAADPAAQKRFLRAARTATQIKHSNVAILYDYSSLPDSSFFMVWEYVDGVDIGVWLEEHGPFPLDTALDLGFQALRGLDALHSAGVIHRDISPDNLMITRDVRGGTVVKIIDLGLAKSLRPAPEADVTQAGMFLGKLRYCSPEQAGVSEGITLDHRTDIYSFAAVFYEMLCGLPPFDSDNPHGFVFKRLTEEPLPLVDRVPDLRLPRELDRVVAKGLARERDERFQDARSFIAALEKIRGAVSQHSTQEILRPPGVGKGKKAAPDAGRKAARATTASGRASLTREERDELLAKIYRTAEDRRQPEEAKPAAADSGTAQAGAPVLDGTGSAASSTPAAPSAFELPPAVAETGGGQQPAEQPDDGVAHGDGIEPNTAADHAELGDDPSGEQEGASITEPPAAEESRQGEPPAAGSDSAVTAREEESMSETSRVVQAVAMLEGYLTSQQVPLARMALEALVEIDPKHPRIEGFERRLNQLAAGESKRERGEKLVEEAREAMRQDDLRNARRLLTRAQKVDPGGDAALALERELEEAEAESEQAEELAGTEEELEQLLDDGKIEEAEAMLPSLSRLGVSKLALDRFKGRIAKSRQAALEATVIKGLDERYEELMDAGDWHGAHEVALEMDRRLPGHPRPAELFAELARRREDRSRQEALEQGVQQVETLIEQGQAAQAQMALKILLKMSPDHPRRRELEDKIAAIAG